MRVLFTSDWQAAWYNLDQIDRTVRHILSLCSKHSIKVVVHCGDVKQQLNPVDIRVTNFMVYVCQLFKSRGIRFIVLLGNHDRVGMFDSAENWFPALKAAGAETVDTPRVVEINGYGLFMLPFMDSDKVVKKAKEFTKWADPKNSILVFHAELDKCMFNVLTKAVDGIRVKQLYPKKYMYVIGGHMHMPQQLGSNVYYVGSPFCEDWGEANQRKRFLIVDLKRKSIKSVPSRIPGMYDPLWPAFDPPAKWDGALVRIHVLVDAGVPDVLSLLEIAKRNAQLEYPGAVIVANPEFMDDKGALVSIDGSGTDKEIIETYVAQHCPSYLSDRRSGVVSYLLHKLSMVGAVRRNTEQVKLLRARVRNVLSFKKATVDYTLPGITVVTGRNDDWKRRSNGSGKTSFLQFPAIAFSGKTLKGQKHNKWMRSGIKKEECWVEQDFKLANGRVCRIIRGRRPKKLQLFIDGKDKSTGFGSHDTQLAIEALTGFTWQALKNVLYIDQAEVNEILAGTDSKRKEIFSQFLNFERFGKARELIKKDITAVQAHIVQGNHVSDLKKQEKRHLLEVLAQLKMRSNAKGEYRRAKKAYVKAKTACATADDADNSRAARDAASIFKASEDLAKWSREVAVLTADIEAVDEAIGEMSALKAVCPMCKQRVTRSHIQKHIKPYHRRIKDSEKKRQIAEATERRIEERLSKLREEQSIRQEQWYEAREKMFRYRSEMLSTKKHWLASQKIARVRAKYKLRLVEIKAELTVIHLYLKQLRHHTELLQYSQSVFGKDGVPAFMALQLCPALNKATEKYSRLFTEGEIRVKFAMNADKDIDVSVYNLHGGDELIDQSQGEKRMASIITCFALRDVLSICNALILDEPGESLDQYNAMLFARALKEVSKRFGTILLTTHNPYILSELSEERRITIVKRNKVSRLV